MSRFDLAGHDEYRVRKAREELAAAPDMSDDRPMARKIGRLEVALQQLLEMLDEGGPTETPGPQLPAYGPSEVFEDEGITPHVIVRVAIAMSREQLITALTIGVTNLGVVDPAELSDDEVRREVEAYFATCGIVEIDTLIAEGWLTSFAPAARQRMADIVAAVERAYPEVSR
ncbi:hypothetical protein [Streptomyces sp. B21-101]|uniref:hypothetical protein n=1 Tax=Streptomyces sp. B21-101 TaxID=3039415 RepID=UPI002FF143EF